MKQTPVAQDGLSRCSWAGQYPLELVYHDQEWGVPETREARLFELLTLEGAQAGLSWRTVLAKRDGYRRAFCDFDIETVAAFDRERIDELVANPEIIRHRGKIEATVNNARAILDLHQRGDSLSAWLWQAVDGVPQQSGYTDMSQVPAATITSKQLSQRLVKAGFRFIGPTTCYALMQAAGLVNDHVVSCHRHDEVAAMGRAMALAMEQTVE